ncbi:class I SAM-dependent methyltransferase [Phormidium sp. CLA17]|uniref:class I SAM-dependent methyltransferase n=1 Tax=Leptolyngbya sp. Cla-17 TaxID=2803751 RepID=UPI001490EA5C|nr:class I SAM-dependent methyltransferase [Leptolyngbya sp. Cla-17]MBM0740833.1 class I SAM-dependent methyltransferase [Leptolyngbya sp. Cla-17]
MNIPLPPGNILQQMYLKERLRSLKCGEFIEVGCGQGYISKLLLDLGWRGTGYDLNPSVVKKATHLNQAAIDQCQYNVNNEDWFSANQDSKVDLVISCLVLEHLDDFKESCYFNKCRQMLKPGGRMILFVPGSPKHWGIEDEIAGHYRRYTSSDMQQKLEQFNFSQIHLAGLTYPLSNWLLPLSNFLVEKAEQKKLKSTIQQRTQASGDRRVLFKTSFPFLLKLILNEAVMYPFYLLQKSNLNHPYALILYAEAKL